MPAETRTIVIAQILCGRGYAYSIHAFSPAAALGRRTALVRSPSASSEVSIVPPLQVIFGRGASSPGVIRYATTALSA